MAWTRLDDKFFDNQKVRDAGKEAAMLYISGLVYVGNQLSDGFISEAALELVAYKAWIKSAKRYADKLVAAGLWEKVDGGYQIHDYLEYNPSKLEIQRSSEEKAKAGRKGGQASAQARAQANAQADAQADAQAVARNVVEAEGQADAQASAQAEFKQRSSINPSPLNPLLKTVLTPSIRACAREVFTAYENEIGTLTPFIADSVKSALEDYPENWIVEAIHEAAANNAKSWKYVSRVLESWKANGFKVDTRKKTPVKFTRAPKGRELDAVLEGQPIFAEDAK